MTTTTQTKIDPIFMEQARHLAKGSEVLPSLDDLARRLQRAADTQTPLRVKLGLDPTRPDLHLGHTVVLQKLRQFQDLGHQAVLIIGDATAMIGDPSGKSDTRPPLKEDEIEANAKTYLDQASKVLAVDKANIVHNSAFFNDMHLGDFLKLAAKATVAQILERDDFDKRYKGGQPIYLHEVFYPLMQGYDSVMIDADIELGGTDQRFNNLMGRELQNAFGKGKQQLVLLAPILEGTDGKIKMSKSYPEHCINLTDTSENFYGKIMSIPDALMHNYQLLLTPATEEQLTQQKAMMDSGQLHPRDVKATLAKWLVQRYFDAEAGERAEQAFVAQFQKKEIPDDIPEKALKANEPVLLIDLLNAEGLIPSKSEGRRLIKGGGIKLDGKKVTDENYMLKGVVASSVVIQVGKRKFLKVHFK